MRGTVVPPKYEDEYTIKPAYYWHNSSIFVEKYMEKEEKSKNNSSPGKNRVQ
jgi:hypothetical protein